MPLISSHSGSTESVPSAGGVGDSSIAPTSSAQPTHSFKSGNGKKEWSR